MLGIALFDFRDGQLRACHDAVLANLRRRAHHYHIIKISFHIFFEKQRHIIESGFHSSGAHLLPLLCHFRAHQRMDDGLENLQLRLILKDHAAKRAPIESTLAVAQMLAEGLEDGGLAWRTWTKNGTRDIVGIEHFKSILTQPMSNCGLAAAHWSGDPDPQHINHSKGPPEKFKLGA